MFLIITLIIVLVIVLLFMDTPQDTVPPPQTKKFSTVFKASSSDGDNKVLASDIDGNIKQSSNNLTIDAMNVKIGDLTISGNKICGKGGSCINFGNTGSIDMTTKSGHVWNVQDDGNFVQYSPTGVIWDTYRAKVLHDNAVRKDKTYGIRSYQKSADNNPRYVSSGARWEWSFANPSSLSNSEKYNFIQLD